MRGDAGHRKGRATRSESSEKTQSLSPLGRVGGCQQALEMSHIAPGSTCALLPTRRGPGAIPMGHYHQDLVSMIGCAPGHTTIVSAALTSCLPIGAETFARFCICGFWSGQRTRSSATYRRSLSQRLGTNSIAYSRIILANREKAIRETRRLSRLPIPRGRGVT
jgi:hypothetical protein